LLACLHIASGRPSSILFTASKLHLPMSFCSGHTIVANGSAIAIDRELTLVACQPLVGLYFYVYWSRITAPRLVAMACWEHVALSRQPEKASEKSLNKISVHLVFRHPDKRTKISIFISSDFY
jgi:hypothetical protein